MAVKGTLILEWDKDEIADGYIIMQMIGEKFIEIVRVENINITKIFVPNVKQNEEKHFSVNYYKKNEEKYFVYRKEEYYCFLSRNSSIAYRLPTPKLKQAIQIADSINISWDVVKNGATYLVIKKCIGGKWRRLGLTKETNYVDKNISMKEKCIYSVRCVSEDGKERLSGMSLKGISV